MLKNIGQVTEIEKKKFYKWLVAETILAFLSNEKFLAKDYKYYGPIGKVSPVLVLQ